MVHLYVLGDCIIRTLHGSIVPRGKKMFGIAAYLVAARGVPVSREQLMHLFWPGRSSTVARHPLREVLRKLRRKGVPIIGNHNAVWIPRHGAIIDTDELSDAEPRDLLARDLTIMPGYTPGISALHSDWIDETRARMRDEVTQCLSEAANQAYEQNDWTTMLRLAERASALDPFHQGAQYAADVARRALSQQSHGGLDTRTRTERLPGVHPTIAHVRETPTHHAPVYHLYPAEQDTPLLGRAHDVTIFTNALGRAARGHGSAITLTGTRGVGKSRLLRDVAQTAREQGILVARTTCFRDERTSPLAAWLDLIPRLLKFPGAGGCHPGTNDVLTSVMLTDALDRVECLPRDRDGVSLDPASTRVRDAIIDVVDAVAYEQPLLLILENAQWSDPVSRSILHAVAEHAHRYAVVSVTTVQQDEPQTRPYAEQQTEHSSAPTEDLPPPSTSCVLQPLSQGAMARHLDVYRRGTARRMPEELRHWCLTTANGNPYFLEELVNHWVMMPGHTTINSATQTIPFAQTSISSLHALIDLRIQSLDDSSKALLYACAALGRRSRLDRMARVTGIPLWRTAQIINTLRTAGFLRVVGRSSDPNQQRILLRHELLGERLQECLTPPEIQKIADGAAKLLDVDGVE